ncbi:DTW domain-containing protein [Vibrio aestuarianus]|nr:DTW domain-containing protein [Vibrio aestuarianus]
MNSQLPCSRCGFVHQCVCQAYPRLDSKLRVALLMHENEQRRATNTGKLLLCSLPQASVHVWSRVSPAESLQILIESERLIPVLIFPSPYSKPLDEQQCQSSANIENTLFIILDGTWQEAKKMINKSPWLSALPHVHLTPHHQSLYTLRRNQSEGNLCTLEVGLELLNHINETTNADTLRDFFAYYMKVYQADKSGHALKQQ